MDSFWARAHGCQTDDCYELLQAFLQDRQEILGVEAARFLGFGLEVIQPRLQRLVEEGVALAEDQGGTRYFRWRQASPRQP
jgi:hypothetical protein